MDVALAVIPQVPRLRTTAGPAHRMGGMQRTRGHMDLWALQGGPAGAGRPRALRISLLFCPSLQRCRTEPQPTQSPARCENLMSSGVSGSDATIWGAE
jgi:hypothetical protein